MTSISSKKTFTIVFLLSVVLGLVVQLVLPLFAPSLFVEGLLISLKDPLKFHHLAVQMSDQMSRNGLAAFELAPEHQFPSGILSLLYYFLIKSPLLQLPLNGLFTALTAVLIVQILQLFNLPSKWIAGFVVLSLFTPSSMSWVPQISKDVYLIFAVLCFYRSFFGVVVENSMRQIIWIVPSATLIFLVKDHWIEIFLLATILVMPLLLVVKRFRTKAVIVFIFVTILMFLFLRFFSTTYHSEPPIVTTTASVQEHQNQSEYQVDRKFEYESKLGFLDKGLHRLSYTRFKFLLNYGNGNETFMASYKIKTTWDALIYSPFALSLGMLEPLPWRLRWDQGFKKGILFAALQFEMIFVYIALVILIFAILKLSLQDRIIILTSVVYCMVFIFVLAYVAPNLGAINRYRFPFLLIIKITAFGYLYKLKAPKPALS